MEFKRIATSNTPYELVKHETMGYAVFKRCNGFKQQVTKWYFYCGNARKEYTRLCIEYVNSPMMSL